ELASRIRRLAPESPRQWGKMSCRQMICHLSDAFRGPLGERPPAPARGNVLTRTIVKWLAMRTPLTWPRGAATTPDIDQAAGRGTRPAQFDDDVAVLIDLMRRFIAQSNGERRPHPLFGPM